MALTLSYDSVLSRVRISGAPNFNANPFFETDISNWTAAGGASIVRSTAQAHEGVASLQLTPDGVTVDPRIESERITVTAGQSIRSSAWVRIAIARNVDIAVAYFTPGPTFHSIVASSVALAANTWTYLEQVFVVPATVTLAAAMVRLAGTPPSDRVTHIDEAMLTAPQPIMQRSTNQIVWTTVRGGANLPAAKFTVDDYEFTDAVANYYRAGGQSGNITPTLDGVWLKSLARPFLNRKVTPRGYSEFTRPGRAGIFEIVGRSAPVAVTDVRGSKRYSLDINTYSTDEAEAVDLLLAAGDILLVHSPTTGRLSTVPTGYVAVGDTRETVLGTLDLQTRVFSAELTTVAAPGPDVLPAVGTWQSVLNTYATWADVLAAHPTWQSLLDLVGTPADVIVD